MSDRRIPEVGHVYYRVRIMDEAAGTFRNVWQQVGNGAQIGYVDDAHNAIELPKNHSAMPLDATPYFLPGVMNDPAPLDTQRIREERQAAIDAANAVAAAAGPTSGTVTIEGASGQDSPSGSAS